VKGARALGWVIATPQAERFAKAAGYHGENYVLYSGLEAVVEKTRNGAHVVFIISKISFCTLHTPLVYGRRTFSWVIIIT
jgi:hypothetical protein